MRRETADLVGSGLLLAALVTATIGALAPTSGASASPSQASTVSASANDVERGRSLFHAKGCIACHHKGDEKGTTAAIGPDLTGLAQRAGDRKPGMSAKAYVYESIRMPSAFIVPGSQGGTFGMPDLGLTDEEIDAISAFLLGTP
jgi:mono/diheme cytochrome c family protein